ncbi:MAG: hypothetical protein ACI4JJ_09260 [Huintestinicola sp.]
MRRLNVCTICLVCSVTGAAAVYWTDSEDGTALADGMRLLTAENFFGRRSLKTA